VRYRHPTTRRRYWNRSRRSISTQLTHISNDSLPAGGNSRVANPAEFFKSAAGPHRAHTEFRTLLLEEQAVPGTNPHCAPDFVRNGDLSFARDARFFLHGGSSSSLLYHGAPYFRDSIVRTLVKKAAGSMDSSLSGTRHGRIWSVAARRRFVEVRLVGPGSIRPKRSPHRCQQNRESF
jgi:hypothetical protein